MSTKTKTFEAPIPPDLYDLCDAREAREAKKLDSPRLAIKPNNSAVNGVCPICGGRTDPGIPYAICLVEDYSDVCNECAKSIDPGLFWMLDTYYAGERAARPAEVEGCPF